MIREYVTVARSQLQSNWRRISNSLGLAESEEISGSVQSRLFDSLKRKFGSNFRYVVFSSVLFLFFVFAIISEITDSSLQRNATLSVTATSTPAENKSVINLDQQNDNQATQATTKSKRVSEPAFIVPFFITFLAWITIINILRYMRAWILSRTMTASVSNVNQRDAMLMLQRMMVLGRSDIPGLPSRLRLALMQRDFNGDDYEMLQQLDNGNLPPSHRGATDIELNRLPIHIVTEAELNNAENGEAGFTNSTSCNICLAPYELGEEVRTVQCMHKFHKNCISEWFKTHDTCPVCRNKI